MFTMSKTYEVYEWTKTGDVFLFLESKGHFTGYSVTPWVKENRSAKREFFGALLDMIQTGDIRYLNSINERIESPFKLRMTCREQPDEYILQLHGTLGTLPLYPNLQTEAIAWLLGAGWSQSDGYIRIRSLRKYPLGISKAIWTASVTAGASSVEGTLTLIFSNGEYNMIETSGNEKPKLPQNCEVIHAFRISPQLSNTTRQEADVARVLCGLAPLYATKLYADISYFKPDGITHTERVSIDGYFLMLSRRDIRISKISIKEIY